MSKQLCVLVVDDDPVTLDLMTRYLPQAGIDRVLLAANAPQALSLLEDEEIDLVILDIMMPVVNGFELTRMIRKKLKLVELPLIAITSQGMLESQEHAAEVGINLLITKPVAPQKLRSALYQYLGDLSQNPRCLS